MMRRHGCDRSGGESNHKINEAWIGNPSAVAQYSLPVTIFVSRASEPRKIDVSFFKIQKPLNIPGF